MKKLLSMILISAIAISVPSYGKGRGDEIAKKLAEAKAACPDCYRVLNTNGVYFGVTKAQYDELMKKKEEKSKRIETKRTRLIRRKTDSNKTVQRKRKPGNRGFKRLYPEAGK